jgi:meso-butanediol dehydrogenase / (S,S)-butanediol dehydrogenase / diacetyl reductase
MASQSGMMGDQKGGQAAHSAAKGAVIALTRQLAAEGAQHRIRVNSISPGALQTPAALWMLERADSVRAAIPLGRVGLAEDIAPCAVFLASDESSFATGANFVVDGGRTNIWRHVG